MLVNHVCYTSQLKYVFRLEENVSHALGQNSLPPWGEQNSLTPYGNNNLNFWFTHDQVVHLVMAANLYASQPDVKRLFFKSGKVSRDVHVYKTWTGVHGPRDGPGPWTTPWTTPNFQKEIASVNMKIHQRSGYEKHRLLFIAYVLEGLSCNSGMLWDRSPIN